MSDSVRPHRRQPIRLPHPWDSPGKNTGVGCHFLLQCMKVKSEREVTHHVRLLGTLWTAAYQAPPSMGFSRQEYWSGVPSPSPTINLGVMKNLVWYSHLFKNFPQFIVICTVKGFRIVNKAEVDVFLELSCFFDDPTDVGNLISASSVHFSSVAQSCPTLCDPMNCSTAGLPVHHQLPESTQTHVH